MGANYDNDNNNNNNNNNSSLDGVCQQEMTIDKVLGV